MKIKSAIWNEGWSPNGRGRDMQAPNSVGPKAGTRLTVDFLMNGH
nr:hypothetical protein [Mariniblastus sp.]